MDTRHARLGAAATWLVCLGGIALAVVLAMAGLIAIANVPNPSPGLIRLFRALEAAALLSLVAASAIRPGSAGAANRWSLRLAAVGFLGVAALMLWVSIPQFAVPPLILAALTPWWRTLPVAARDA